MLKEKRLKAIDFFCGAGGLTKGMSNAGINVLAGIDIDKRLRTTYENNNNSVFLCEDIENIDIFALRDDLGIKENDSVVYSACTPCQPFSSLNQNWKKDDRRTLLLSFAKILERCPPDFIILENVPGLGNTFGKEIYDEFISVLNRCGFNFIVSASLDAKDYHVPQSRRRFILLASRNSPIALPKKLDSVVTVRDAISKFNPIEDGENCENHYNHVSRKLKESHKKIVLAVPKDGGNRSDIEDQTILLECHKNKPHVHKQVFGRLKWDDVSPTLTCRCTDIYCGRFTHPE